MFIPETPQWTPGVYQIEKTDKVRGGPTGPDNLPLIDLACRTSYLRQLIGVFEELI